MHVSKPSDNKWWKHHKHLNVLYYLPCSAAFLHPQSQFGRSSASKTCHSNFHLQKSIKALRITKVLRVVVLLHIFHRFAPWSPKAPGMRTARFNSDSCISWRRGPPCEGISQRMVVSFSTCYFRCQKSAVYCKLMANVQDSTNPITMHWYTALLWASSYFRLFDPSQLYQKVLLKLDLNINICSIFLRLEQNIRTMLFARPLESRMFFDQHCASSYSASFVKTSNARSCHCSE